MRGDPRLPEVFDNSVLMKQHLADGAWSNSWRKGVRESKPLTVGQTATCKDSTFPRARWRGRIETALPRGPPVRPSGLSPALDGGGGLKPGTGAATRQGIYFPPRSMAGAD